MHKRQNKRTSFRRQGFHHLYDMVWLESDDFKVLLTHNHRVMVSRRGQRQTIPAGHLKAGDSVLCTSGEMQLTCVDHQLMDVDVYEVAFTPDAEIETFYIVDDDCNALLTKGKSSTSKRTHRGNMKRKRHQSAGSSTFI